MMLRLMPMNQPKHRIQHSVVHLHGSFNKKNSRYGDYCTKLYQRPCTILKELREHGRVTGFRY